MTRRDRLEIIIVNVIDENVIKMVENIFSSKLFNANANTGHAENVDATLHYGLRPIERFPKEFWNLSLILFTSKH